MYEYKKKMKAINLIAQTLNKETLKRVVKKLQKRQQSITSSTKYQESSQLIISNGRLIIRRLEKKRSRILTIPASESLKSDSSVSSYGTCWF